ncbi:MULTISPECIES: hypothetical protein [Photorhabdus]|uniref:Uncharacterized protein n=1 Tax=Photorhabdus asymbiotica TaxID=291112 RepID=A0ABX9SPB0_9GAMM|nr:hypothetical protein [Photorhabdus asymbiotica]RKS59888.1 hypothetical protein BDD30_1984 [Photorhabdus asymbiotica]
MDFVNLVESNGPATKISMAEFQRRNFIARLSHYHETENPEICPLSTKSKRFKGLSKSTDFEEAKRIKARFYRFKNPKQGKLSQTDFTKEG